MENNATGADFRAIRCLLNLSQASCGKVLGIRRETIARYEGEKQPINYEVYTRLLDLLDLIEDRAEQTLEMIDDDADVTIVVYDNDNDFARHRPKDYAEIKSHLIHFAMCARIKHTLESRVNLVMFNAEHYEYWLEEKGLTDGQDIRAMWAASQINDYFF